MKRNTYQENRLIAKLFELYDDDWLFEYGGFGEIQTVLPGGRVVRIDKSAPGFPFEPPHIRIAAKGVGFYVHGWGDRRRFAKLVGDVLANDTARDRARRECNIAALLNEVESHND